MIPQGASPIMPLKFARQVGISQPREVKNQMIWFSFCGILLSLIGSYLLVKGQLKTSAAIIRGRWTNLEESWKKTPPTLCTKFTCLIAKWFGSGDVQEMQSTVVDDFMFNFWGFLLLLFGLLLQLVPFVYQLKTVICGLAG